MFKLDIEDIITSVTTPKLVLDGLIKNGSFYTLPTGDVEMYTGGFTLVFPVDVKREKWAFRCWYVDLGNLRGHFQILSQVLSKFGRSHENFGSVNMRMEINAFLFDFS